MKILVFVIMTLILASCSPGEDSFEPENTSVSDNLNLNRSYTKEEVSFSCIQGCKHHYQIYLNANKLVKNAVSLNQIQLDSIQKECEKFCKLDVFYKINQVNLSTPDSSSGAPEISPIPEVKPKEEKKLNPKVPGEIKSLEDL